MTMQAINPYLYSRMIPTQPSALLDGALRVDTLNNFGNGIYVPAKAPQLFTSMEPNAALSLLYRYNAYTALEKIGDERSKGILTPKGHLDAQTKIPQVVEMDDNDNFLWHLEDLHTGAIKGSDARRVLMTRVRSSDSGGQVIEASVDPQKNEGHLYVGEESRFGLRYFIDDYQVVQEATTLYAPVYSLARYLGLDQNQDAVKMIEQAVKKIRDEQFSDNQDMQSGHKFDRHVMFKGIKVFTRERDGVIDNNPDIFAQALLSASLFSPELSGDNQQDIIKISLVEVPRLELSKDTLQGIEDESKDHKQYFKKQDKGTYRPDVLVKIDINRPNTQYYSQQIYLRGDLRGWALRIWQADEIKEKQNLGLDDLMFSQGPRMVMKPHPSSVDPSNLVELRDATTEEAEPLKNAS